MARRQRSCTTSGCRLTLTGTLSAVSCVPSSTGAVLTGCLPQSMIPAAGQVYILLSCMGDHQENGVMVPPINGVAIKGSDVIVHWHVPYHRLHDNMAFPTG